MIREAMNELIEDTINAVCDNLCKYPEQCSGDELDDICDGCPLHDLRDLEGAEIT